MQNVPQRHVLLLACYLLAYYIGVKMLRPNMPFFQDQEGQSVPSGLPPIIDAHVHISEETLERIAYKNAADFFDLDLSDRIWNTQPDHSDRQDHRGCGEIRASEPNR
jgi:hypothetical protein